MIQPNSSRRQTSRSQLATEVWVVDGAQAARVPDNLAVEEPLEIRLHTDAGSKTVAVTMRTPGADAELATGFLFAEGVIESAADLQGTAHQPAPPGFTQESVLDVRLRPGLEPELASLERHFFTSSACGLCGRASQEALLLKRSPRIPEGPRLDLETLYALPERLRAAQGVFQSTGGLHAAALFTAHGRLLAVREDVGRHNALDKLIGWALGQGLLPLHEHVVLLSGRASYELLQKCLMAEVPVVCAVSAPSSAALSVAREMDMTLVGFLRGKRLNVYHGGGRLGLEEDR